MADDKARPCSSLPTLQGSAPICLLFPTVVPAVAPCKSRGRPNDKGQRSAEQKATKDAKNRLPRPSLDVPFRIICVLHGFSTPYSNPSTGQPRKIEVRLLFFQRGRSSAGRGHFAGPRRPGPPPNHLRPSASSADFLPPWRRVRFPQPSHATFVTFVTICATLLPLPFGASEPRARRPPLTPMAC